MFLPLKPVLVGLKAKFTKRLIIDEKGNHFLWSYSYPPGKVRPAMRLAGPELVAFPTERVCGISFLNSLPPRGMSFWRSRSLIPAINPPQPDNPDSGLLIAESERGPCNEALEATQHCPVCKHHDRSDGFN